MKKQYTIESIKKVTVADVNAHIEALEEEGCRYVGPECGWTWLVGDTHALRIPKSMVIENRAVGMAFAAGFPLSKGQTLGGLGRPFNPPRSMQVVTLPDDFIARLYDADAHHGDALNLFDINGVVNDIIARRVSITYTANVIGGVGPVCGGFEIDCLAKPERRKAADQIFPLPYASGDYTYGHPVELNIGRIASTFGVDLYGEDTGNLSIWRRLLDDRSFLGFECNGGMLGFGEIGTAELTDERLTWTFTLRDLLKLEEHTRTPRMRNLRISAGVKGDKLPTGYAASLMHRLPGGVSHITTKVNERGISFRDDCTFEITWTWPVLSCEQAERIARVAKVIIGEHFIDPVARYVTKPVARLSWGSLTKHLP